MADAYVANLKTLSPDKLAGKRDEVRQLNEVFKYLTRFKIVPEPFAAKAATEGIIKAQGWDKRPR
jgi:hypothetical protein